MNQQIIFEINKVQKIIIKNLCFEGGHTYRYDPVEIIFKDGETEYIISQNDFLNHETDTLYYYLQDAIANKLTLDKSIKCNIGFLWNEYLQDKEHDLIMSEHEGLKSWIGTRYLLFSGNNIDTWMYNKNNKIFIEFTPSYKWHHSDPKQDEDFVSYEDWIKEYEPIKLVEIDSNIASVWLQKLEALMKEIKSNDSKYLHKEQGPSD